MKKKSTVRTIYDSKAFWVIVSLLGSLAIWIYVSSVETEEFKETFRGVRVELNEEATPKIDGETKVDLTGSEDEVALVPSNVKPGLLYGLGHSDSPAGPYVVEEGGWVQADADGKLPRALTAPKAGASGYYRVVVR